MKQYKGKSIFKGIAIGKVLFYEKDEQLVKRTRVNDVETEITRFVEAKEKAIEELNALYEKALVEVGEVNAAIFEVHTMMLEDDDYNGSVMNIITTQGVNAEYAVATTSDNFVQMFEGMTDDYFKARAADIKDISERLISVLRGKSADSSIGKEPVIVVAKDLAPSETVQMDKEKLLAFVTELGSQNSHTAILARTMNIPALIGIEISRDWNGKLAIVDGYSGSLTIEPDDKLIGEAREKQQREKRERELLRELNGKEDVTLDGRKIKLYANIGNVSDVSKALANDANGIGLFRSEFLYIEKDTYPTEEEQFQAYKAVAENMAGKRVIIRTLDIGADKKVDYMDMGHEENPAMGYRAIRICLDRTEIFKIQLRAILRASLFGNISIMYPMIISVAEVKRIKEIVEEVKAELTRQQTRYGEVEQGIMIETPAAVMISDLLAKEVDFFSIGTNDLTQYTLAIDRQNQKLDNIYDPHHPAILRMIETVVRNGHSGGCWVGICGELGADTSLTAQFLKMGIDELSVSPSFILPVRKIIRETDISKL